uniref:Peroxisomal ATPase PEX1 N-terminal C-lobe domain-containing protein n=1 Tax=Panagrolaimus sp. ES5 TaxID=591445 RepID=A0AC34F8N6_9BILA
MSANNPVTFVIQTFGDRPPFNFLLINPSFALITGIKQGDHLLMEPVNNLPTCISMEIEPETFEDWNIIESTACIIEEIFLDHIRVVRSGMKFVLFVAPGVPAKFQVLNTDPDTSGRESAAVMATNITEVLVAPRKQPKCSHGFRSGPSSRTSSIKPSILDKLTNGNTVNGFLKEFIHPQSERQYRILPRQFLEEIEFDDRRFGHQSFVIALNGLELIKFKCYK